MGAVLLDPRCWPRISELLEERDFYASQHRAIFRSLAPLAATGQVDVITLSEALRNAGDLDAAGGMGYLHQLVQEVPSIANAVQYARIVAERACRRQLASAGTAVADSAMHPSGGDSVELLLDARRQLDQIEGKIELGAAGRLRAPRIWLDEAALPPSGQWLVKGLIGARDLVLVYGQTSCGKTFWTIDLVASIAAGLRWRQRRVRRTPVAYVAAEAGQTILRRFVAWRDRNLGEARQEAVPLAIIPRAFNLLQPLEVAALMRQLRDLSADVGTPVGLVVIDTLSRSMPGGDENSAEDMTKVIAAADRIREELGATVALIHHSGKDVQRGARGHSALAAAADTIVSIVDRVATFEKVRDGVANTALPFDLEVVDFGRDEDGEAITTCVAAACDEPPPQVGGPRLVGLGENQEKALGILRRQLAAARRHLAERGDDPASAWILTVGWRDECEKKGIDRRRWAEVRKGLEDRGLVTFDGPHAVPVEVAP